MSSMKHGAGERRQLAERKETAWLLPEVTEVACQQPEISLENK